MPAVKPVDRKGIPLERLRYANDIRKFARSELSFLNAQAVIDAGCGNGLVSRAIKKQYVGVKLVGVDCDREAIALARHKARQSGLKISYVLGDLRSLPFGSDSADVVVCTLVMHHLSADVRKKALREFLRVLKKGGALVILEGKVHVRRLAGSMKEAGFGNVQKRQFGKTRNVYSGAKTQNPVLKRITGR